MKLSFVQFAPELANVQGTIKHLEQLLAGQAVGDLIVLPELSNSGYNFESREQAVRSSEELNDSPFVNFLRDVARRNDCRIVSGFNEREGNKLYNSSLLIGADGVIGKYRKMHLFLNEKDFFVPGNLPLVPFDIGPCRIGMLICFDWVFPEIWRILAMKGADIICHPSNLVLPGFAQRGIPAHAMINRIFVVTANRIGEERGLAFTGNSIICDPKGIYIAQGPAADECVMTVEIDIARARDKMVTPRNHLFEDRRPADYTELLSR